MYQRQALPLRDLRSSESFGDSARKQIFISVRLSDIAKDEESIP